MTFNQYQSASASTMETGADSAGLINTNDSCLAMEMTNEQDERDPTLVTTKQSGKRLIPETYSYETRICIYMCVCCRF